MRMTSPRPPMFTPEEARAIHARWVASRLWRIRNMRKKFDVLEEQIRQLAHHVHYDLQEK
ncbi:MAG: hypothetical protein V1723_04150 [Candidatus Uhrbacteria bacterium]